MSKVPKTVWIFLLLCLGVLLLSVGLHTFVTSNISFGADFWTFWLGGKAVFVEHASPYSDQVILQSQMGIYGRAALPGEDPVRFSYPIYSLLPVWPAVWMPYEWAQAFWLALNFVLFMAVVLWAVPALSPWVWGSIILFYPVTRGLILGQFSLTVGWVLMLVYGLLRRFPARDPWKEGLAGILLVWTTIKPQFSWLFIGCFLLWAFRDHLFSVLKGFVAGLIGFVLLGEVWYAGWLGQWIIQAQKYLGNYPYEPLYIQYAQALSLPLWSAKGLIVGLLVACMVCLVFWWQNKIDIALLLGWAALATQVVSPQVLPTEHVLFLLPLLIWAGRQQRLVGIGVVWFIFACYWLLFFQNFQGKEPLSISFYLPLLYALWLGVVSFKAFRLTKQARSVVME